MCIRDRIKQKEVDERIDVDEAQTMAILDKLMKQRRESIVQYEKAGRDDLVAVEQAESTIIQTYLPAALDQSEIDKIVGDAITTTGAASIKDMGKVMGAWSSRPYKAELTWLPSASSSRNVWDNHIATQ